jgi:hypothetical protein
MSASTSDEGKFVEQCCQRVGREKWILLARWMLVFAEPAVAAGAAKILFDAGERRLPILGDVAMSTMHDGGYFAESEKILSALIQHDGDKGVRWLANRIAHTDQWMGAHSGWWRVLLEKVQTLYDGPELLAACIHNLGPFTLPRHPEVREGFARLLSGMGGDKFREALRARLSSLDPRSRRGAALVLVTSDPQHEAEALFVAIRSRANRQAYDWHEWENFCLTLNFSPSVLLFLKSKLPFLDAHARALAIVLLEKGGIELDRKHRSELLKTLSSLGNWHLCSEPAGKAVLESEASFDCLMEQLDKPNSEAAQRAAERLLEFHAQRLTPRNEAKCLAIRHGKSSWTWELPDIMRRVFREPDFSLNLIEATKEIDKKGGRAQLLGLIAKAIKDQSQWKDVLWALFCDDTTFGGSSASERAGMAVLEFGFETEEHRKSIGEAAKKYLDDPRFKQNRWHEAYHWLALIADEFAGLDHDKIRNVIVHGKPIGYSATTALIARLGEVPETFSCERAERSRPQVLADLPKDKDQAKIVQDLKEYSRNSDELHPALLPTLQECLFLPPIGEPTLSSISKIGRPGILIATTLRFIYGQKPKMAEAIPLLDRWATWRDSQTKPHLQQLARIWTMIRESTLREDTEERKDYLAALDAELLGGDYWKLPIAWEILEIRGFLTEAEIAPVFVDYADHPTFLHEALFVRLCMWLSGDLDEVAKKAVIVAAENAIVVLNEAPWVPEEGKHPNVWADLLFPTILWVHDGKASETSEAVFLRGIRSIFDYLPHAIDTPRTDLTNILARLDPLLEKVSSKILQAVLSRGLSSAEPSVTSVCRLIKAVSQPLGAARAQSA